MQNLHLYCEDCSSVSLYLGFRKEVRIEPTETPERCACVHRGAPGRNARYGRSCPHSSLLRLSAKADGITLSEYVRRRAMTRAAQDLLATDEKVIDIALRYGYESPTAFSKAFRRVHGMSPSDVRQPGAKVTLHPRLIFTLSVKGEEPMDYRIIE